MNKKTNQISRRKFLKESSLAAAGASVVGGLSPAKVLGANERIRIGVLGSGGQAQGLMGILNELLGNEIVAVCDVYGPHRLEAAERAASDAQQTVEYREVLDRKDVDAVVIGAPNHWHKQMVVDAVRAGKDVYCEKPISHSIEEGVEIVRAVEQTDRIVQVGMQQRSWEHFRLGKQIVDSGKLGKIPFVHAYWYQNALTDSRRNMVVNPVELDWKRWVGSAPDQPFDSLRYRDWRYYWDFGGGALTDLLVHWIDVIHWYMDQKAPLTALAEGRKYVITKEWETPDTVTSTYEFPGNFTVTFMNTYVSSVSDGAIEFRGTKGTLKIDRRYLAVYPEGVKWVPGTSLPEPEILMRSEHDGTRDHLQNFLDCMRSRKSPNAPVGAAHEAARTCHLGNIALRRGQKVTWDSKREKVVL